VYEIVISQSKISRGAIKMKCLLCNKDIPIFPYCFWGKFIFDDGTKSKSFSLCQKCVKIKGLKALLQKQLDKN